MQVFTNSDKEIEPETKEIKSHKEDLHIKIPNCDKCFKLHDSVAIFP